MLVDKDKILELIPQAPPMAMVDGLIASDDRSTSSRLILDKNNIFCQDGFFHEPGLVENMAQTAALRGGFRAYQNGSKPKTGFIGSIKNFSVYRLPSDHATLQTTITVTSQMSNAMMIKGQVFAEDLLVAEGEMSIFEQ